jgi:PadR family transcriptional regulator, regulatory protein PadR
MSVGKLSLTEAVIAHLLRRNDSKPLCGSDMVRLTSDGDLQLKKGTIYVTLERMENKGLIVSQLESPPAAAKDGEFYIPRRMYRLTPKGSAALKALEKAIAKIPGGFLAKR